MLDFVARFVPRLWISQKITLLYLSLMAICLVLFISTCYFYLDRLLGAQRDRFAQALVHQTSNQIVEQFTSDDQLSLNLTLAQLSAEPWIQSVALYDNEQRLIAGEGAGVTDISKPLPQGFRTALNLQEQPLGYLQVALAPYPFSQVWWRVGISLLVIALAMLGLTLLAAAWLNNHLYAPLSRLKQGLDDLQRNELQSRLATDRQDEYQGLFQSYNQLAVCLQERQEEAESFMRVLNPIQSLQLGKEMGSQPKHTSYISVAALYIEFDELAELNEILAPQTLNELINQYYGFTQQAAKLYGGIVEKVLGSGVMLLFGMTTQPSSDHGFQALCAAMLLAGLVKEFNGLQDSLEQPCLHLKMGLHVGPMLYGQFGETDAKLSSVMGEVAFATQKLARYSEVGSLTISQALLQHSEIQQQIEVQKIRFSTQAQADAILRDAVMAKRLKEPYRKLVENQVASLLAAQ